jgi:hypothetical protein
VARASLSAITCVSWAILKSHDKSSFLIGPADFIGSD